MRSKHKLLITFDSGIFTCKQIDRADFLLIVVDPLILKPTF